MIPPKPPDWPFRFAAHLGVRSPDTPLFLHSVGSADPVAQIRYVAGLGFAGVSDNGLMARPPADQVRIGSALAEHGLVLSSFVFSASYFASSFSSTAIPIASCLRALSRGITAR